MRQEHFTRNGCGSVSVIVYGDQEKPALITYPDLALNHMSCFQGLFFCPEADSLLLHNFCIYHISPPGHEFLRLGAASICPDDPVPSVDDLADRNLEVLNFFGLGAVMCMGLAVGGYIFSLFAVMLNMLYFYGMCGLLKERLLQRYFSEPYLPLELQHLSFTFVYVMTATDPNSAFGAVLETAMQGRDMLGRARKKTGKTLPNMGLFLKSHSLGRLLMCLGRGFQYDYLISARGECLLALVLASTRERVRQGEKEFHDAAPGLDMWLWCGTPISRQMRALDYGNPMTLFVVFP
ncbi:unnamed protein product [Malus baccata var. baccata]